MAGLLPPASCLYPIPRRGLGRALPSSSAALRGCSLGKHCQAQRAPVPPATGVILAWAANPNTPNLGGQLGKAAWRRAGSFLGQQQRRTGRARQENPEFSPPRCFACLTASRALPVGLQPLPALGAPQPARSPGRSREVLQEPSLPQSLPGRCPSAGVCPLYSPHGTCPSPVSIILFHRNHFFPSLNTFPMKGPLQSPGMG